MDGDQQTDSVDTVPDPSKRQGKFNTEFIYESSPKESEDGESAIQSRVLPNQSDSSLATGSVDARAAYHVVSQSRVRPATTSHTTERIEHTGAEEADESHHSQLNLGRRIPRDGELSNLALAVHPSRGKSGRAIYRDV
jgi:hypothetical protein